MLPVPSQAKRTNQVLRRFVVGLIFALMALSMTGSAAGPIIGVAVSEGSLLVNQGTIQGNANLEAGSVVTSLASEVRVRLSNGAAASLIPKSVAQFGGQSMELKSGGGIFSNANGYPVNALGFDVRSEGSAKAKLYMEHGQLQVGALDGQVKVTSRTGVLVARVMPGKALALAPAALNDSTSTMTGTLRQSGDRWTLRDETTNVEAELQFMTPNDYAGRRVEVTGKALGSNGRADQVIEVARLIPAPEQGGAARPTTGQAGSSKPGSTAPAKQGGGGMSSGAKVALILAVGGGGAAGVVFATMSR